jgi:putative DNA primase/helicase
MEPGASLLISAEDGIGDTIRPRLDAQGADVHKVHVLDTVRDVGGTERLPDLKEDIPTIEAAITRLGVRLLVIDPLNAYTGATDSHVDADVRKVLTPLAKMAERTGVAVIVVMHLTKTHQAPGLYRVQGSIGFIGAARSVLAVAKDESDPRHRVLAPIKANLAAEAPALVFTITEEPALSWLGTTDVKIEDLLRGAPDGESTGALSEATDFLRQVLADGPVPAKQVAAEAREAGINERTLRRAKDTLGVHVERAYVEGRRGVAGWNWLLPDLDDHTRESEHLNTNVSPPPHNGHADIGDHDIDDHADTSTKSTTIESEARQAKGPYEL